MNMSIKKKIAVVVLSRANYGRIKYVMKAIEEHPDLELQLILGASALIYRYGKVASIIKEDGFLPTRSISFLVEGETLSTQAKTTGMGTIELATAFEDLKPDAVITVADRHETMATAIAASYQNIPLIHIQGGEISGNIDNKIRHAITQLSDFHFPATEQSKQRIISMGISPTNVYNFGCPAMDVLNHSDLSISNKVMKKYGGTGLIDWNNPYILVVQHPVTTSYGSGYEQILSVLKALKKIKKLQKVVLWPNSDAGSNDISKGIREFRENLSNNSFSYFRNFSPEDYARVLANSACLVGNSSSFIREGAYLGVPAIIVGDRQKDREYGKNASFVSFDNFSDEKIFNKVSSHLNIKKFSHDNLFGSGNSGKKIANKIYQILFSGKGV